MTPESAHCLGKLQSDVSTTDHQEVFRNFIQFECFDVRERLRLCKPWSLVHRRMCPRPDHHIGPAQQPRPAVMSGPRPKPALG